MPGSFYGLTTILLSSIGKLHLY
ncbi:hypothetical protein F383_09041 [Gossypium arboreum]|uniref:Uncharacterized protein n=1 Tax=Gossypium arboreum TaxID=29729 RepID=A0A0B0MU50_GOSAR|nr:hypothetical protein F383_09041 [Gossypium arboreum]